MGRTFDVSGRPSLGRTAYHELVATPRVMEIPELVRIKPGVLGRVGEYLERVGLGRPLLLSSAGLPSPLLSAAVGSFATPPPHEELASVELADLQKLCERVAAADPDVVVGLGGGRALDAAKWIAAVIERPYVAVPSSVSNDGIASPNAALTLDGRRKSLPARTPYGVLVDTTVCAQAPDSLWLSGVGDVVAKITAVQDWKLAYHATGIPLNDMAALLSDASVSALLAAPFRDPEGLRLLATALLLNGLAMQVAGSSRPASGSEHLISHALDEIATEPHPHGIQVGVAAYVVSRLQEATTIARRDGNGPAIAPETARAHCRRIAEAFETTGLWSFVRSRPFRRSEFLRAVGLAPSTKRDYFTVLDTRDCGVEVERMIETDPQLLGCFRDH